MEGWSHYIEGTIDSALVDAVVGVVPVFLSPMDATFWANVDGSGDDIRFTEADGTTEIPFHIVSIDVGTETGCILLRVAESISTSLDITYRLYFGNALAANASDSADVFSGLGYSRYYLPGESLGDMTGVGSSLIAAGSPGQIASGIEGINAATYNGTTQYHYNASPGVSDWPISVEVICSFDTYAADQEIASVSNSGTFPSYLRAYLNTNPRLLALNQGASGSSASPTVATFLTDSTNYYMAVGRDSTTTYAQVANVDQSTQVVALTTPTLNALTIGALQRGGSVSRHWDGTCAMMAVSSTLRSPGYVTTAHNSWLNASFWSWGESQLAHVYTGWLPFTVATGAWVNKDNALSEDENYSYFVLNEDGTDPSTPLLLTAPDGIDIPAGSEIAGVSYRIRASVDDDPANAETEIACQIYKGGAVAGAVFGDNLVETVLTYEYPLGLHSLEWDSEDFGSDFGLSIVGTLDSADEDDYQCRIHAAWVNVAYIPGEIPSITGTAEFELPALEMESAGDVLNPISGTAEIQLPALEIESAGDVINPISGAAEFELPALEMESAGTYTEPDETISGTAEFVLPALITIMAGHDDTCVCCRGYTMANLLEMRKLLVKRSGNYDLVVDAEQGDWADNGADEFIRAAQRRLDDLFEYHKSEAWLYRKLSAGQSLVTFQNARIVKQVWICRAGGERTRLERLSLPCMRTLYAKGELASIETGTPLYWTSGVTLLAPEHIEDTAETFESGGLTDYDLVVFGEDYPNKSIYVMPPADQDTTVEVLAEWYTKELCDDTDVSFWSQFPELLVRAARSEMEADLHRNSQGRRDFDDPLLERLQKLYHNLIAEESSGPASSFVMEG